MSPTFLRRTFVTGALSATLAGAAVTGASTETFSPASVIDCNSDVTCSTVDQAGSGQAFEAQAARNNGSVGTTSNPSASNGNRFSGVWGRDLSSDGGSQNVGVTGSSTTGTGVRANSSHFVGLEVQGGNTAGNSANRARRQTSVTVPAFAVTGGSHSVKQAPPPLIDGCASGGPVPCNDSAADFRVANNGAITVASCTGCSVALTRTSSGRTVDAFTARVTTPTVEDIGEGHVTAGRGYVPIDPAFAETMDRTRPYLVTLTPEGPSRGLYVADRTPGGFAVRENPGGAATLAFTYRIVAKPFDSAAQRLPADGQH
jgi:hypothetical protein